MANEQIEQHYIDAYKDQVALLAQEKKSKFESAVETESGLKGDAAVVVNQFGQFPLNKNTDRFKPTVLQDITRVRRWYVPDTYDGAVGLDRVDILKTTVEQESPIVKAGVAAVMRQRNAAIIDGIYGTNLVGQKHEATKVFDTNNVVTLAAADSATDALDDIISRLQANGVDIEEEEIFMSVSHQFEKKLKQEGVYISYDYQNDKVLSGKKLIPYSGINFIRYQNNPILGTPEAPTGVRNAVWCKSGVALGKWDDLTVKVDQRPDLSYAWQIFIATTLGGTRTEEAKVLSLDLNF